jgi:hypothetical protein
MPARDPAVRAASARLAAEERHHPHDDHADLRRALRQARGEESIGRLLDLPLAWRARQAARLLTVGDAP